MTDLVNCPHCHGCYKPTKAGKVRKHLLPSWKQVGILDLMKPCPGSGEKIRDYMKGDRDEG